MKYSLDKGAYKPEKAHAWDAGFDLRVPKGKNYTVNPGFTVHIDTGVHVELPFGTYGKIEPKSGLARNKRVKPFYEGVVDAGYTGSIVVSMVNEGLAPHTFREGDKVCQLVVHEICTMNFNEQADKLAETDRGANGFGSTGR